MPSILRASAIAFLATFVFSLAPTLADTTEDPRAQALLAFADGKYEDVVTLAAKVSESSDNAARCPSACGRTQL